MGPDKIIIRRQNFRNSISEYLIGGEIGEPEASIKSKSGERSRGQREQVVKKWPKIAFAETVIESLLYIRG